MCPGDESGDPSFAFAVMTLGNAVSAAVAIIAVGFAVATANRPVVARADFRRLDALPGAIGLIALLWRKFAPQKGSANKTGNAAAQLPLPRDELIVRMDRARIQEQNGREGETSFDHGIHSGNGTPASPNARA